jgi:hypothetical protein
VQGAAFKYDLLTALGAHACAGDKHRQRLALRLMVLITARYDWRSDMLTTGQREIAALWSVDERTVKREVARLRAMGWLVLKRPAARGRVACHGLGVAAILADTRPAWDGVGPDFVARLAGPAPEAAPDKVVPFPAPETQAGPWGRIAAAWAAADPATHMAWIAPLRCDGLVDGRLILRAPSAFHATYLRTHHLALLEHYARREVAALEGVDVLGP